MWDLSRKLLKFTAALIVIAAFVLPLSANAAFIGPYAVDTWQISVGPGLPPGGGTTVDTSGAPDSIEILGGDAGCSLIDTCVWLFEHAALGAGTVQFDWLYESFDVEGPALDVFGFVVNGAFTRLSGFDAEVQSDTTAFLVDPGDLFGFAFDCTDCIAGPANVVISNFSAPLGAEVPEPSGLALLGLGFAGLGFSRRRRSR